MVFLSVFLAAFVAATILPLASEAVVVGSVLAGKSVPAIWLVASIGNTLGSLVNALLGRLLPRPQLQKLLRLSDHRVGQAERVFHRYGRFSLLFAWLPVLGDALTVVAGILRTRWLDLIVLVFIGKAARYAVVIWLALKTVQ